MCEKRKKEKRRPARFVHRTRTLSQSIVDMSKCDERFLVRPCGTRIDSSPNRSTACVCVLTNENKSDSASERASATARLLMVKCVLDGALSAAAVDCHIRMSGDEVTEAMAACALLHIYVNLIR